MIKQISGGYECIDCTTAEIQRKFNDFIDWMDHNWKGSKEEMNVAEMKLPQKSERKQTLDNQMMKELE